MRLFICMFSISALLGLAGVGEAQPKEEDLANDPFGIPLVTDEAAKKYHDDVFSGRYGLPKDADDIKGIRAEIYQSFSSPGRKPTKLTDLPSEDFEQILKLFQDAEIENQPLLNLQEVGSLLVTTKDGRIRRLTWYGGTKAPLMFSLQGVRCISKSWKPGVDSSSHLEKIVRTSAAKTKEE